MNISIIGSGNVATAFGRMLHANGHRIVQVYSRTITNADRLARELNSTATDSPETLQTGSDLYLIAISDDAIFELKHQWKIGDAFVVHTAGSVDMEVLRDLSSTYGVFYPLQSMRKELTAGTEIPFLIDGNTELIRQLLFDLAGTISRNVRFANNAERKKLHLAAVIANNFANHIFTLTEAYCKKEGVDFEVLFPLLRETTGRLELASPFLMQTGPARRHDQTTISKHESMLEGHPQLLPLYRFLTESISTYYPK